MVDLDAAKDLMSLAGGPSILGVAALLAYITSTLSSKERVLQKGWYMLGAQLVLIAWLVMFILLAAPLVFASWAQGGLVPTLILLSATWFVAIGLVVALVWQLKAVCTYVVGSVRDDEGSWLVKLLRKLLGKG